MHAFINYILCESNELWQELRFDMQFFNSVVKPQQQLRQQVADQCMPLCLCHKCEIFFIAAHSNSSTRVCLLNVLTYVTQPAVNPVAFNS